MLTLLKNTIDNNNQLNELCWAGLGCFFMLESNSLFFSESCLLF